MKPVYSSEWRTKQSINNKKKSIEGVTSVTNKHFGDVVAASFNEDCFIYAGFDQINAVQITSSHGKVKYRSMNTPISISNKYVTSLNSTKDTVLAGFSNGTVELYKSSENSSIFESLKMHEQYSQKAQNHLFTAPSFSGATTKTSHISCSFLLSDNSFVCAENSVIHFWNVDRNEAPTFSKKIKGQVSSLCPNSDNIFSVGSSFGQVRIIDKRSDKTALISNVFADPQMQYSVRALSVNPFVSHWLAYGDDTANVGIIDWRFPSYPMIKFSNLISPVTSLSFLPTHTNLLVSGNMNGTSRLINVNSNGGDTLSSLECKSSIVAIGCHRDPVGMISLLDDFGDLTVTKYDKSFFRNTIHSIFDETETDEREVEVSIFMREFSEVFSQIVELAQKNITEGNSLRAHRVLSLSYQQILEDYSDWHETKSTTRTNFAKMSKTDQFELFAKEWTLFSLHLPPNFSRTFNIKLPRTVKATIEELTTSTEMLSVLKSNDYEKLTLMKENVISHFLTNPNLSVSDLFKLLVESDFPFCIQKWIIPFIQAFQSNGCYERCISGLLYVFYPTIFEELPESYIPNYDKSLLQKENSFASFPKLNASELSLPFRHQKTPSVFARAHKKTASTSSFERSKTISLQIKFDDYSSVLKQLKLMHNISSSLYASSNNHKEKKMKNIFSTAMNFFTKNGGIYYYSLVRMILNEMAVQDKFYTLFEAFGKILPIVSKFPSLPHFESLQKYYIAYLVNKINLLNFQQHKKAIKLASSVLLLCYSEINACPKTLLDLLPQLMKTVNERFEEFTNKNLQITKEQAESFRSLMKRTKPKGVLICREAEQTIMLFVARVNSFSQKLP